MLPIEQACYWMATSKHEPEPPLQRHEQTEIAIVGGGFTGLWTALYLKELAPEIDVALLEQSIVGYGGSGRNAGIIGETVDHSHSLAVTHFGLEEARKLASIGRSNIREMAEFLAANHVDCDFERTGRLAVALTPAQFEEAKRGIEIAEKLGVTGVHLLDASQIQAEIHSPLYLGGIFSEAGGILNPFKLVLGLKRLALQQKVRIFEHSPVLSFHGPHLQTAKGSLRGRKVILATDAYTHLLFPKLLPRFIPLYDYVLVSEPLTPDQHGAIGWRKRQGVTDGRTFFNYYRLTADNRIVWGTSEAMYYASNRVDESCDHSRVHYKNLHESFLRHFPQLAGLRFPYAWGGPIASTTRLTPFFGTYDSGRILYALGYTGHGIGSTRIAAKILAHLALERPSELLELKMVRKKPFPYPPEPLRSIAVRAVTSSLRRVDRGEKPNLLLRALDKFGIGFSS